MIERKQLKAPEEINPLIGHDANETLERVSAVLGLVQDVEIWRNKADDPKFCWDGAWGWHLVMDCARAALGKQAQLIVDERIAAMSHTKDGAEPTDGASPTH